MHQYANYNHEASCVSMSPAINIVVVCRLHYINTLKQELNGTKAYEETSKDEQSVVYSHLNEIPNKFVVDVKERQDRLPTMYWLPKLHKRPYKARFIANSSSCTTTELSKLLTSCLTAIKAKVIKYCETVYERSGKNMFWPIKNSGEVLSKLKDIGYQATSLSTYDFSTLYTTLPHNLIKEKLLDLIERTFYKKEGELYLACNAPVICIPRPLGAGDTGDIAGLKCRNLTSDVSRQCRGCAGVLISR